MTQDNNNDLLSNVINSSLDMIQVFKAVRNEQHEIIDFTWILNNKTSERIYGDVIGKSLLTLNPGVVEEGIFDTFKKVVDTGEPDQSVRHYVHEQFNGWFLQSTVKQDDGVATTTKDITALKTTEHDLQKAKKRLQTVLDSSLYIVQAFRAVRDDNGKIIDFTWLLNNQKAFEQNGAVIGESLLQINPGVVESGLFEKFVEVTETGVTINQEVYYGYEQFNDWFHQTLVKMDDGFVMNTEKITEKKKAEQEILRLKDEILQKTSDRYYSLFNSIDEGYCIYELIYDEHGKAVDLRWIEVNPAHERQTGLVDVVGKRHSELSLNTEHYWYELYDHVVKTGESLRFENWHEGTSRWYSVFASRIGESSNRQLAIVFQDITGRKKADEALRASEAKYRTIFETIDEGFTIQELITDENGRVSDLIYREVNEAYSKHLGITEAVGKRARELFPHIEQYWLDKLKQVHDSGESLRVEGYQADLHQWITAHYARVGGPGSRLISAVFQDITERKQREQQQQFLIKFSDALRAEPDANAIANRAIQMLAEYLELDRCYVGITLLDENRGIFPYQCGNDRVAPMPEDGVSLSNFPDALRKTFEETLVITDFQTTEGLTENEKQNFAALGFGALVVANVRKEETNPYWSINAVSATARQWTAIEIQLVEEATERTWAAVERAKAEEAVRHSEARLKDLLKLRDEFIGVASHELKTPVTSIKSYAEIVQESLEEDNHDEEVQILKRLNEQIDRLTLLITDMLDTTKISEGKMRYNFSLTDINKILKDKVEELSRRNESRFSVEFDQLPMVEADAERIGQVISNLLTNALKYSPNDKKIFITTKNLHDRIYVEIKDEGLGISKEYQQRVFDRFFRISENNMDTYPGLGLGLYIAADIIHQHNGVIGLESETGKGSTFFFTLPVKS